MAVTVTSDFTQLDPASAITNWTVFGSISMHAAEVVSQVEGSACIEARWSASAAEGGAVLDTGAATSWEDRHLYMWIRASFPVDTFTNGGIKIRVNNTTTGGTNYGEWLNGGQDRGIRAFKGWYNAAVDVHKPYDATNGTTPTFASMRYVTAVVNPLVGSGKDAPIVDEAKYGSKITIGGGGVGTEGQCSEIASDDNTNGRGLFKQAGGVYFVNCHLEFGNSGVASSYFYDTNRVIAFENLPMSASLYKLSFIGNAVGTNNIQWGNISGTGTGEEGASGIFVLAAGSIPFRIEAINTNVDQVDIAGSSFLGPSSMYDDALRNFKIDDNGAYTDATYNANHPTTTTTMFPATEVANQDSAMFGHNERFSAIVLTMTTAATGTYTVDWQYYNGSTWTSLTDDNNFQLNATGTTIVDYSIPDDWVAATFDSDSRYWIRCRLTSGTFTVNPVLTQAKLRMGGGARIEDPAVKFVGCTFTNMDTIRVRNGAFLKKALITDSVASAKNAALDLGSADPTANTVRDITIQNCEKGVLLKGSGDTTYNLRNFQFVGNNTVDTALQGDNGVYTDFTDETNDTTTGDINFFPATPVSGQDQFYIGDEAPFNELTVTVSTGGAGGYTINYQYWNGSSWTTVSGLTDDTTSLTTTGENTISFTRPTNWARSTINSTNKYWFRIAYASGTMSTNPVGTQIEVPGDVRVDFGGSDTVTINILEGGDSPQVDNVNGSTVVINNNVNITITVQDKNSVAIPGAEVAIFLDNEAVVQASTPTDENGQVVASYGASSGGFYVRVRQSSATTSFNTTSGISGDTITTDASHTFSDGDAMTYSRNGGSQDIGPEPGTWYAGNTTDTTLQLYDSAANAVAGTATGRQTLTGGGAETHTLASPIRYVATSAVGTIGSVDVNLTITLREDTIAS